MPRASVEDCHRLKGAISWKHYQRIGLCVEQSVNQVGSKHTHMYLKLTVMAERPLKALIMWAYTCSSERVSRSFCYVSPVGTVDSTCGPELVYSSMHSNSPSKAGISVVEWFTGSSDGRGSTFNRY